MCNEFENYSFKICLICDGYWSCWNPLVHPSPHGLCWKNKQKHKQKQRSRASHQIEIVNCGLKPIFSLYHRRLCMVYRICFIISTVYLKYMLCICIKAYIIFSKKVLNMLTWRNLSCVRAMILLLLLNTFLLSLFLGKFQHKVPILLVSLVCCP